MRTFFQTRSGWRYRGGAVARALATRLRTVDVGNEDGLMLIEVLISALLVALVSIGTFNAFDASNRVQRDQRVRAQATTLAQQDEERLRSLGSAALAKLKEEKVVTFQKTEYTIVSKSEFVSDTSGEGSCSSSKANADYFETTSEVSWTGIGKRPKVVQTGLVEPPAGGELVVLVEDGRGGRTSGMNIVGTGPASLSGTTGTNGCLVFGPLEEGTYTVNATQAGYVGRDGETEVPVTKRPIALTGQTTASDTLVFNKAGKINATLVTAPSSLGGAQTLNVIAKQTELTAPRDFLSSESGYTSGTSEVIPSEQTFFPFASKYVIFAGSCAANNPENFGGEPGAPLLEPGATVATTVTEPGMIPLLYTGTSSSKGSLVTSGFELYVKDTDTGEATCNNTAYKMKLAGTITTAKGSLERPGLPFGEYTVCALFTKSGTKYRVQKKGVKNSNTTSGTTVELFEGGGSPEVEPGSTCP